MAKRIAEGNERYSEHKAKKSRGASTTGDSGLRPGGAHTFAGPCNPSGNAAASSSGMNRQGEKRRGLDVQPNAQPEEEHSRKYQRQDDEEETENQAETQDQQEGDTSMDVATGEEEFQPDKEDSDCMFVEHWNNRRPRICHVQGGAPEFWDDICGKPLDTKMVLRAREDEMGELAKHEVYEKVPTEECWKETGAAPIGTR